LGVDGGECRVEEDITGTDVFAWGYEDAREFWVMLKAFRKFPDLEDKGREGFGRVRSE
jgi:hypothetical protein